MMAWNADESSGAARDAPKHLIGNAAAAGAEVGRVESLALLLRRVSLTSALVGTAIGVLVLAGWSFQVRALMQVSPELIAMAPDTAVGFVLLGLSLFLRVREASGWRLRTARVCAAAAGLMGLLVLAEYASGANFGIDELLFRDPSHLVGDPPGRLAAVTALCFVLLGGALAFSTLRRARVVEASALLVGLLALVSLTGYAYGVRSIYWIGVFKGMALHTALVFLVLSIGVLYLRPDGGFSRLMSSDTTGGIMVRRVLPIALGVPLILGWVRLVGQRAGLYSAEFGTALYAVSSAVVLVAMLWWIGEALHRTDAARRRSEAEIRQLNAALEARVQELNVVNRELEAFSYSVSHDLRGPLRAIDGFSQVLLEDHGERLEGSGRDALGRVRAAAARMARLIDDMLKLSRVTQADLQRARVDLSEMARGVVAELARREPGRHVDTRIADGVVAEGDAALLQLVLENLLDNAFKFTSKAREARVEFGVERQNGGPVYYVRDNGAGFDAAYAHKLFGAFQRLHSEAEFPGTGIGLATVQRIVHRHGGRVWAEGAVDRGATFRFTL